jgi:hypothetical protein
MYFCNLLIEFNFRRIPYFIRGGVVFSIPDGMIPRDDTAVGKTRTADQISASDWLAQMAGVWLQYGRSAFYQQTCGPFDG